MRNINAKLSISAGLPLFHFTDTTSWTQGVRFSLFRIKNCSDYTLLLIISSSLFSVRWDHPIHTDMLMTHFSTQRKKISNESSAQREKTLAVDLNHSNAAMNIVLGGNKTLLISIWLMIRIFVSYFIFTCLQVSESKSENDCVLSITLEN